MIRTLSKRLTKEEKQRILALAYSPRFLRDAVFCLWHGLTWRSDWRFYKLPIVRKRGTIIIGRKFVACSDSHHNSMGVNQRVLLHAVSRESQIVIGDNVGVSGCTISAVTRITIGDNTLVGTGALIVDYDGHAIDPYERLAGGGGVSKPVTIGGNVFVGGRAIILKGVTIGEGSVVGAGSVVTKDVPPFSIVCGNPARVVGSSLGSSV